MSLLDFTIEKSQMGFKAKQKIKNESGDDTFTDVEAVLADYHPKDEVLKVRSEVVQHFNFGYQTMNKPRHEFNDLSVLTRLNIDQMAFNTYQPNNGNPAEGDIIDSWRSNAMRPIVRNKIISIVAHATATSMFPTIFAYDEDSEEQAEAAEVMDDLIHYSADQTNYNTLTFYACLTALFSPVSLVYSDYCETYRKVKTTKGSDGKWNEKEMLDEDLSGFQDQVVPADELYIENFYEADIQKQGWLIWRKVQSYSLLKAKYGNMYENFKFVKPGVQLIFNDANQSFYEVYDSNMRGQDGEEVIYWNKGSDVKIIMVNGVMLTEYDNPNPRIDKQYPMTKFGFEPMDEGKCFYYMSLAFKLQQDARIINTLYPMIIDGTYLNLMPPMINVGGEAITNDVIVPGAVTTLSSPDADLRAVKLSENLQAGMNTLFKVDESINQSSDANLVPHPGVHETAYAISIREKEAQTQLGPFLKMIETFVKDFGKLRVSDILQYLTIVDATKITSDDELVYKTFLRPNKNSDGKTKTRKIQFDSSLPSEPIPEQDHLDMSYELLIAEGRSKGKIQIYKVNPEIFRKLKYECQVTPDILKPMSKDAERAFLLEEYDRAISNPILDQEEITKDFLLAAYPKSRDNTDKYIKKEEPQPGGEQSNPLEAIKGQMTQNAMKKPQQVQAPQNLYSKMMSKIPVK